MSDDVEKLPRDYRKTLRVAVVLLALFGPPVLYVRAMEKKLDDHVARVGNAAEYMVAFAEWNAETLNELCKATPGAKCKPPPVPKIAK